jgi:hypothetical protein
MARKPVARRFVDGWYDGGNSPERSIWAVSGPSRRLRKLYQELFAVDCDIELARKVNYCVDHAPTDYRIRRRVLKELNFKRDEIVGRINRLQNNGEE